MSRVGSVGRGLVGGLVACAALLVAGAAGAQVIGAPEISEVATSSIGEHQATVSATIAPHGQNTTYEVWVSYSPCPRGEGECGKPRVQEKVATRKVSSKDASQHVERKIGMLTPGCYYDYWFVASNGYGKVESEPVGFLAQEGHRSPAECRR